MGLINLGAGLSEMGASIAQTAGNMGLNEQKQQLENDRLRLADTLAGAREHQARVETGAPQDVAMKNIQLKEAAARTRLLYGDDGTPSTTGSSVAPAGISPAAPQASFSDITLSPDGKVNPPPIDRVAAGIATKGGALTGGVPSSMLPPTLTPEAARYMQIVDPAGFRELVNKWLAPTDLRIGNEVTYRDPFTHEFVTAHRNQAEIIPFTDADRTKYGLSKDEHGYVENGVPHLLNGAPLVQLKDGTYSTRDDAIGKVGPLSTSRQAPVNDENDPDAQAWFAGIANGNANAANIPGPLKNVVMRLLNKADGAVFSPRAKTQMTLAASRITQNYIHDNPQYQLVMNGLPFIQRIDAASKGEPNSVKDLDLLDSMIKLNTNGNAVTEQQVKTITDGRSWADSVGVMFNKVQKGGVLSNAQRKEIHDLAGAIFTNYRKGFEPLYSEVTAKLDEAGIPNQFWSLPNINDLSAKALAGTDFDPNKVTGAPPGYTQAPDGNFYRPDPARPGKYLMYQK